MTEKPRNGSLVNCFSQDFRIFTSNISLAFLCYTEADIRGFSVEEQTEFKENIDHEIKERKIRDGGRRK